jgi:hypothetical protein
MDLLAIALLIRLLRLRGLPPHRVLIYAWNPLVVVEVAWSGHLEPAGVACVLAGAAAIIQKRPVRGALALALAGLIKVLPFFLFVPVWRHLRPRAAAIGAALALAAVAYAPFFKGGMVPGAGLGEYARRWRANGSIFPALEAILQLLDPAPHLKAAIAAIRARVPWSGALDHLYPLVYPPTLARAACLLAALGILVAVARRVADPARALYLSIGAALLLSPTVHPWYLIWAVPWMCLFPSPAWILLSGLVALAYLPPSPWVPVAEYGPPLALLAAGAWRRRRPGPLVPPRPSDGVIDSSASG